MKIKKVPAIQDLMYAHGGSSIHKVLEEYYNGATADIDKLKELFNQQWTSHKLDETKLKLKIGKKLVEEEEEKKRKRTRRIRWLLKRK